MSERDFEQLLHVLEEAVKEMMELKEAVSLLEKQILDKVAPLPIQTVRRPRKKVTQTSFEKDSLEVSQKSLDDKQKGDVSVSQSPEGGQIHQGVPLLSDKVEGVF